MHYNLKNETIECPEMKNFLQKHDSSLCWLIIELKKKIGKHFVCHVPYNSNEYDKNNVFSLFGHLILPNVVS